MDDFESESDKSRVLERFLGELSRFPSPARPGEPLWIALAVEGEMSLRFRQEGMQVLLESGGCTVCATVACGPGYTRGRMVPSRLEVQRREVRRAVDDWNAEYPLVVDPSWIQQAKLAVARGDL